MAGNGWRLRASRRLSTKGCDKDVDASKILEMAVSSVLYLLSFHMQGFYTIRDIALVVVQACSRAVSINQTCKDLKKTPDESTVRHHLSKLSMRSLERRLNSILPKWAVKLLPRRPLRIAMDLTYIPYHGKPKERITELRNGLAKHGTNWFHVYASAYVILYGRRYTLALKYVRRRESLIRVIEGLLKRLEDLDVSVRCLFLDRGFYTIDVINYLKVKGVPFVMPVVRRGRSGGVRRLLQAKKSFTTEYSMRNLAEHKAASFFIHVVRIYLKSRYRGKHGSVCYGYAFYPLHTVSLKKVFDEYRKRFGIESSYRLMNQSRARTSSRDPKRRLLFVAVSFILINTWVYVKWESVSLTVRGRHGRRVLDELLPYRTVLTMLCTIITRIYGIVIRVTLRP
jgi:putative transposase